MVNSLREITKERSRETICSDEWLGKARFGESDLSDFRFGNISDTDLRECGITEDWRKELVRVSENMWIQDLRDIQDMPALVEEEEEGYSSSEYDYDYTDYSEEYHEIFKDRLGLCLRDELPKDKKRNPTLMGKQLVIKAFEEGKNELKDSFKNSEAGKEARDALFKTFVDFPRTIMYMAKISHSLS